MIELYVIGLIAMGAFMFWICRPEWDAMFAYPKGDAVPWMLSWVMFIGCIVAWPFTALIILGILIAGFARG